ncbi:MAG TPA: ribosome biogenesis GTPase YlqF [Gammaproteobacteria bacterium]|jgi:ribosome biogenesis GTPase A|nr:ribosome biogenesis GTPase YlqF [Pseudomonadales bacterium]MBT7226341.1 ribosome biogenesis GTPase YlqF [Gammaproteobacteria bacterium]MDB3909146.1 ribosome biogenesis GTPase YlqF [Gammaproteobacteria bacterium]HAS48742.1 ribosome biogenesis GTPase YlqF [Gammaproteobacteria bacterium]
MAISWYPGHMHKASKELVKIMLKTDAVIEVLDARIPESSCNPLLATIRGERPCIRILNKADLADSETTAAWAAYFSKLDNSACLVNGRDAQISRADIVNIAKKLIKKTDETLLIQGQIVIDGIPNVGKSTLLNQLTERKVARTGNEPAVTKGQQRVKLLEGWYLIDTPGMLWPKLEDQESAYRLAVTGTIRNTAIEVADIAWFLAELLMLEYPERLASRYDYVASDRGAEHFFDELAKLRGSIGRGGKADLNKTAEILLNDFRSGKLGKFSLEKPPT